MKKNSIRSGFSLVEFLLYMGLLVILLGILTMFFSSIIDVQLESKSSSSVDEDGRYIIARLIYDMHRMKTASGDTIVTPIAPGALSNTLNFTVNSINYIYSLNNGNLQLANNTGTNNLNSVDTQVSGLQFIRIGTGTGADTIRLSFNLQSKTIRNLGAETRSFQTTISSQ